MIKLGKKILKALLVFVLSIILIIVFYLNIRLYYNPSYTENQKEAINEDVWGQIKYLKDYLHKDGGKKAQERYPEGFVFINALYGLTWVDFIEALSPQHSLRKEGLEEISWALNELNSRYGAMWFPEKISPAYGVFYKGWKNYLLAKKVLLQKNPSEKDVELLEEQSQELIKAFQSTRHTYLESYQELVWPADNIVAIASLSLYNKMNGGRYNSFLENYVLKIKSSVDSSTGLIPHEIAFQTRQVLEGARGSSQSLMLNFLMEIDEVFAKEQFEIYKELFLDYRFGLPGIREYPKGSKGGADVDSGPVLLEVGGSASLVGQRTMALYNEVEIAVGIRNSIEAFGLAYSSKGQKKYVLGLEPIADAFIAWSNVIDIREQEDKNSNWRYVFQLLSIVLLGLITLIVRIILFNKNKVQGTHKKKSKN